MPHCPLLQLRQLSRGRRGRQCPHAAPAQPRGRGSLARKGCSRFLGTADFMPCPLGVMALRQGGLGGARLSEKTGQVRCQLQQGQAVLRGHLVTFQV